MDNKFFKWHTILCAIAAFIAFVIGASVGKNAGAGIWFGLLIVFWWIFSSAIFWVLCKIFRDSD